MATEFEQEASLRIRELRLWMGICGGSAFLLCALVVVAILGVSVMLGAMALVVGAIYLVFLTFFAVIPGYLLVGGARSASMAYEDAPEFMVMWAQQHTSFWTYMGVLTVLILSLYALLIALALAFAVVGAALV